MPAPARPETRKVLSDSEVRDVASRFGTPLYVLDEAHFRARIRRTFAAFRAVAPNVSLSYASKANSTLAILRIAYSEGCRIDVASEGELRAALAAGIPASACDQHGNNKTRAEIEFGFSVGVGRIIVDNQAELSTIADLAAQQGRCPDLVFRLAPGVDPKTHAKISTGQADTKFGFQLAAPDAEEAVAFALRHKLPLAGFHCHVGSQLLDPTAQISGGEIIADFAARMKQAHGFEARVLNVGGGVGIRYTDQDEPLEIEDYCRLLVAPLLAKLQAAGLTPELVQEPGRSLIGESGVTLYRVGVAKEAPGVPHRYVVVDGGLSDNPRPALYGAQYTLLHVPGNNRQPAAPRYSKVAGKHCETDTLFFHDLPADTQPGDLIQVLCTGAYNASMASNYNRYPRPAAVLLRESGEVQLIQRPDTWEEMLAREHVPEGL